MERPPSLPPPIPTPLPPPWSQTPRCSRTRPPPTAQSASRRKDERALPTPERSHQASVADTRNRPVETKRDGELFTATRREEVKAPIWESSPHPPPRCPTPRTSRQPPRRSRRRLSPARAAPADTCFWRTSSAMTSALTGCTAVSAGNEYRSGARRSARWSKTFPSTAAPRYPRTLASTSTVMPRADHTVVASFRNAASNENKIPVPTASTDASIVPVPRVGARRPAPSAQRSALSAQRFRTSSSM